MVVRVMTGALDVVLVVADEVDVIVTVRVTEQRTAVAGQGLSEVQAWPIAQHFGSSEVFT